MRGYFFAYFLEIDMALRTPLSVTPHLYMGDSTGRPLDKGVVYFGEQDKDPEFYPINLFSDDALTKPLAQPVHTKGGYLYDKGDMVEPHAKELIYSVKVLDSYGRKVFYKGAMMRNSWNDDVIEQINTAIISSADVARQVATDITNDAINNTAIEGGVLADTFVVVDGSLSQRTINKGLESIADLSTIKNPKNGLRVYVKSYHAGLHKGGGIFTYNEAQITENNGGTVINGWVRDTSSNYLNTYHFGAIADGTFHEEDTRAFQYISAVVNNSTEAQKSFKIHIEAGDYVVGIEKELNSSSPLGQSVESVLHITFKTFQTKHITVQCDSAYIKLKDGMRYGTFLKETQEPYHPKKMPFYNKSHPEWVEMTPYITVCNLTTVFKFNNFSNLVIKGEVDIDLNSSNQVIGGRYGDTGWQLICYGMQIFDVQNYDVENVYAHDSCLDGMSISSYFPISEGEKLLPETSGVLRNIKSYRNGRQGLSFTGGQNVSFYDCAFYDIAIPELPVKSSPGSCFDLEASGGKKNRNIKFYGCYFGQGNSSFVADSGDSKGVHFEGCTFINKSTALWCAKKNISFNNCIIKGKMVNLYGSSLNPSENVTITNSLITDNTDISSEEVIDTALMDIYGGVTFKNTIFSLGYTVLITHGKRVDADTVLNPMFDNCTIILREGYRKPKDWVLYNMTGFINWVDLRKPDAEGAAIEKISLNNYLNTATHVIRKQPNAGSLGIRDSVIVDTTWNSENHYLKPQTLKVIPYIEKSTENSDTATKLNSLIDSLNAAGLVLPKVSSS